MIRGTVFERGNPTRKCMELGGMWRVAFVHCLDVIEEHGKGDSVVEGMVKDNDKVIFIGG